MKTFFIIFFSLILIIFQLTLVSQFDFFWATPNFILSATVAWVIYQSEQKLDWLIILPALILDLLIGRPFGVLTLAVWLVCALIIWLSRFLFKQSGFFSVLALALIGILSFEFIFLSLVKFAEVFKTPAEKIYFSGFYFSHTLPVVLISNAIFCFLFFFIFQKAGKYFFSAIQPITKIK